MIRDCRTVLQAGAAAGLFFAVTQQVVAADVTSYYVRKGNLYEQSSAAAPTAVAFTPNEFIARLNGNTSAIDSVTVATPSDFFSQFDLDQSDRFEYSMSLDQANIDTFFPSGPGASYSFTVQPNNLVANLPFPAGTPPTAIPQVLNFAAAQTINPTSDFTLNFSPFTGAGANDSYELEILSSDTMVFQKSGTGTSVVIPAGTLSAGENYDARLRFVHNVTTDTTSIAGATGSAGYFNETQFTIGTSGSSGGTDTTPPALMGTFPQNGATGVATTSQINFIFSEAMVPQQSIQWSANVNPANFNYSWGQGNQFLTATYSGGFPANSTITWALQGGANGFKDLAGNPLAAGAQGSFSTASSSGTNDNCNTTNSAPSGIGTGTLFKLVDYTQTGNNTPVLSTESPASALASFNVASNQTVTAVKVTGPTGQTITLSNVFGKLYLASQDFPSPTALDAFIIPGTYTVTATGAGSGTINVPAATGIPVPRVSNLVELASFDPTKDFILQFSPFTGAGTNDSINVNITAAGGRHFYAPDYCLNRSLPNTATSVVIPANTFIAGDKLSGDISFSRFAVNTNGIPNTYLSAGLSATTSFDLTGSTGGNPSFNTPVLNPDGTLTLSAQASAGQSLVIEKSTNLVTWAQVAVVPATTGTASYTVDTKTGGRYAFFRAKVQ